MANIIIKISGKSKLSKLLVDMAEELSRNDKSIEVFSEDNPNKTTINAIDEARNGKTTECRNFEDYLQKVNK